ncbi:MAG: replicative DNA helicase [Candidatus Heritagella sp.]
MADSLTPRSSMETQAVPGLSLPFSSEAEQSVLGAVLLDSSCLDRVTEILPRSEYFYQVNNRMIYEAMLTLFTGGKPVDFVTVLEALKENPDFEAADGRVYLMQLAQFVPSIGNVESYAHIVRDRFDVRQLMLTARGILDDSVSGGADAATLLDSAEQRIFDIRRGKNMQGLQRLNEVILDTFEHLDRLNSEDRDLYRGIPTGIGELDRTITGLNRSDLIILAARPGMGKTSFALNIARNVAVKSRKRVAFFSLEMGREQLASRLLSTEAQVGGVKLRTGELDDAEWARLIEAGDILGKAEIYLDDNPTISVAEMKSKVRRLKDVDLIVIDYLQLMGNSAENRVQEISAITRNLKIMAKELNVPVITLSQLARASEKRTEHRPVLSDLRDSGSIEQDADIVLFLYREDYYSNEGGAPSEEADRNSAECIIAKNRHGETRTVPLHWQGEFMRFTSQEVFRHE